MEFNVQKITKEIIDYIRDYYQKNNLGGAVIGLSGGKDSAVCLALMVESIGKENVLGLWLPANSKESDKKDVDLLVKKYNVKLIEFDLEKHTNNYIHDLKMINNVNDSDLCDVIINLKPRFRMMTLYSYAALMTKLKNKNYIVIGTSNKSERFVGYFTKGGDGVSDLAPIADLYVDEVIMIGKYLGVPDSIIEKTPNDGLSDLSDEEKLGFTYSDVKKVSIELENNTKDNTISNDIREKILKRHQANLHKLDLAIFKRK